MKSFFASFFGTLFAIALVIIGGFLLLIGIISLIGSSNKGPTVENKSVLVIDLSVPISDAPAELNTSELISELSGQENQRVTLREVLRSISLATTDDRIPAIFLTGNVSPGSYSSGLAALREIREALLRFKQSKKPVYAHLVVPFTRTYYVASVADKIYLDREEGMAVSGLVSEQLRFASLLKKFGIGVQVSKQGKYKSAVEPFLLDNSSPENTEQVQALLSDFWTEITTGIEQARGIKPGTVQELIAQKGLIDAETALEQKLVTNLEPLTAVMDELKQKYAEDSKNNTFRQITVANYLAAFDGRPRTPEKGSKVGIVYAEGEIVDGEGDSGTVGGDKLARAIRKFRFDPDIKGIVLRVNSPGGSALASEVIRSELESTQKAKPVVVSMGTVAASGGYWISTAANRVFAEPGTITGSIGVFGLFPNVQKLANENGVFWNPIETSPYSDLFTISRPKTDAELAVLQRTIDHIYDDFLKHVSDARHIPVDGVKEIAQGRVWSGSQAIKLHLVDEIGGLQAAISYAGTSANLGDNPKITEYPAKKDLNEKLKELFKGTERPPVSKLDPINRELKALEAELHTLTHLNDPQGIYALLPIGIDWK
ncbi:MAG TPA: signal peptide peptidase SppA [Chthoniobacterales bacterium]|jgi:protease IV|nr:signal peptide peptidase SppA [Chthoniobacterales bacterium]